MNRAWIAISVLAGAGALWLSHDQIAAPYISNDGYQYLDAASNFLSGQCLCTELAHFDEQVAAHRLPLPLTHFPPGYPLLIVAVSRLGPSLETSGYLLAAFGFLATIWLLWDLALMLGARTWIVAAFCLLWITHANALWRASSVTVETPFAAALLAIAALIARDEQAKGKRPGFLLAMGAVAGVSYWLRYAGLFLIPVAILYIAWRFWRNRETLPWAAAGVVVAGLLTATLQIRNIVYSGSWRGGFTSGKHLPPTAVFEGTLKAFFHQVSGDRVTARFDIWTVLFLLCLLTLLISVFRVRLAPVNSALLPILLLAAAYVCGILATSLTSIAQDFERYYLPLYPLLLAIAAVGCSMLASSKIQVIAIAGLVLAALVSQGRNLSVPPRTAPHVVAREELQEEVQPGVSAGQWLQNHVGPADVLIAVNGQAVHYVLQRRVISLIPPEVSTRPTDESAYRSLLTEWQARYLLLFPSDDASEQEDVPFLKNLASGAAPAWLTLAAHAPRVAIYECGTCSQ